MYPSHQTGEQAYYKAVISYCWFVIVDVRCQRQQHLVAATTASRFIKFVVGKPNIVDWMCGSLLYLVSVWLIVGGSLLKSAPFITPG
jgi:hypothetical protein